MIKFQAPNPKQIPNPNIPNSKQGLFGLLEFIIWNLFGIWILGFILINPLPLQASEVIEETHTAIIVREHPKTGRPYVSIVSSEGPMPVDPFTHQRSRFWRPDYRMLDPKVKARDIPYNGPSNDRKKVYVLAATLATVGAAGGIAGIAAAPAATGTGASGGAGIYFAGAGAVAAGTAAAGIKASSSSKNENFIHRSESRAETK